LAGNICGKVRYNREREKEKSGVGRSLKVISVADVTVNNELKGICKEEVCQNKSMLAFA
jgi:hypothetical protein